MADYILRELNIEELRQDIVRDVLASVLPVLNSLKGSGRKTASRQEMAQILGWSIAKLDRRTSAGAIPSLLDGDRRVFEVEAVFDAIRKATPEAERLAAERQQAKRLAKKQSHVSVGSQDVASS